MPKSWLQEKTIKFSFNMCLISAYKKDGSFVKYMSFILPLGFLTPVLAFNIQKN